MELRIWILPFDLAQGGESFDFDQDREPVERFVEPFDICKLVLEIFSIMEAAVLRYPSLFFMGHNTSVGYNAAMRHRFSSNRWWILSNPPLDIIRIRSPGLAVINKKSKIASVSGK